MIVTPTNQGSRACPGLNRLEQGQPLWPRRPGIPAFLGQRRQSAGCSPVASLSFGRHCNACRISGTAAAACEPFRFDRQRGFHSGENPISRLQCSNAMRFSLHQIERTCTLRGEPIDCDGEHLSHVSGR